MASGRERGSGDVASGEAVPPGRMANVPPQTTMLDHSFTLQAVMELQKSVAELGAKTDRLISDVEGHGKKIDEIREIGAKTDRLISDVEGHGKKIDEIRQKISFVRGAVWVIGAAVVALGGIATWYGRTIAPTAPSVTVAPASPAAPRQ